MHEHRRIISETTQKLIDVWDGYEPEDIADVARVAKIDLEADPYDETLDEFSQILILAHQLALRRRGKQNNNGN